MVITFCNQKGGTGKSTMCHVLACGLINRGYSVLVVDCDPQGNISYTSGAPESGRDLDAFMANSSLQAIKGSPLGYHIITSSPKLVHADKMITSPTALKDALAPTKKKYDFILIDTNPSLNMLSINAMTASDRLIIPMQSDIFSLQGLAQMRRTIDSIRAHANPQLMIDGLLITRYNPRAKLNRAMKESAEEVAKLLHTKVYASCIREAVAVRECAYMKADIFKEYPKSKVTQDCNGFVNEFLKGI